MVKLNVLGKLMISEADIYNGVGIIYLLMSKECEVNSTQYSCKIYYCLQLRDDEYVMRMKAFVFLNASNMFNRCFIGMDLTTPFDPLKKGGTTA